MLLVCVSLSLTSVFEIAFGQMKLTILKSTTIVGSSQCPRIMQGATLNEHHGLCMQILRNPSITALGKLKHINAYT